MEELGQGGEARVRFDVATDPAGNAVVTLAGELDISAIDALEAKVQPVLSTRPPRLIVDASALRFADSSAIALWVRWSTLTSDFELRNPPALLRRVINGMGLAEKLAVSP